MIYTDMSRLIAAPIRKIDRRSMSYSMSYFEDSFLGVKPSIRQVVGYRQSDSRSYRSRIRQSVPRATGLPCRSFLQVLSLIRYVSNRTVEVAAGRRRLRFSNCSALMMTVSRGIFRLPSLRVYDCN